MGSCVSIHKNSGSSLKIQMSSLMPEDDAIIANSNPNSIPSTPIKDNNDKPPITPTPAIVDPRILSLRLKSQTSRLSSASIASYRSFGSKEEAFYDTQVWLESDCDDDFYSVNGDFSSRGSTPARSAAGTPRVNRVFSPQVNRAVFEGRPFPRSGSSLTRGSTPAHQRNSSSPQVNGTFSEVVPSPNRDSTPTIKKKKKLADLFRESIRERAGEFLALEGEGFENQANPKKESSPNSPASVLPPKSGKLRTPHVSGPLSQSSSGKITPADDYFPDREKTLKSQQCCFPRLNSIRSYRENRKASNSQNQ